MLIPIEKIVCVHCRYDYSPFERFLHMKEKWFVGGILVQHSEDSSQRQSQMVLLGCPECRKTFMEDISSFCEVDGPAEPS